MHRGGLRFGLPALAVVLAAWLGWICLRPATFDREKTYRMGYGNDAPLHFVGKDGLPAGLAVELVQEAARRTGIKLEWVVGTDFDQTRMDLWVLMTVRPERSKLMHLTAPYLQAENCFLVRADSPIHEVTELAEARISYRDIGILRASLQQIVPGVRLLPAGNMTEAIAQLASGQADAVFVEQHVIMSQLLRGELRLPLRMLPTRSPRRPLAIASSFANAAVAEELRRSMQTMVNDRLAMQLIERWTFFFDPATAVIGEVAHEQERVRQLVIGIAALLAVIIIMSGLIVWSRLQAFRLSRAKKLLRDVADRVPGLLFQFQLNADGTSCFPYASEAMREIYRTGPESVATDAAPVFAVLHPDDREGFHASIRQSAQSLTALRHEYRVKFDDGTVRWLAGNAVPEREGDGITLWHGFITDITDRKAAEAAMQAFERKIQETQKLESLGLLAGGIAHDFNNILTGIIGNSSLASMSLAPGAPEQEYLEAVREGGLRAAELCKQMLAYSGKGRFVIRRLSLNTLVEETTKLLRLSISKQAELRFNLAPGLPAIEMDQTQIRQVLMNLVINASDAIGVQSGCISLRTSVMTVLPNELAGRLLEPDLPAGSYVCLEVSDTGCGMSAETKARIFDPFFTTKFTGRGLGLSAVHGIVRAHHGVLKVYSELGRGTTFKLFFPFAEGSDTPAEIAAAAKAPTSWRGQGCILVIDDEASVRKTLSATLHQLGFTVVTANDGLDGLNQYRESPERFSAVLMDLTMPRLDGKHTLAELRRIRRDVRVVLMSGFTAEEVEPGIVGFLPKPFEFEAIVEVMRRAVGESPP